MTTPKDLLAQYQKRKPEIKKRLREFEAVWKMPGKRIFAELCFCICTPQSKAVLCDEAISALSSSGLLYHGSLKEIRKGLMKVRFPNNKARFILEARKLFFGKSAVKIKKAVDTGDIKGTRHWLSRTVKGIGLKEASHFLRNIGFGEDLAILDVHILKKMARLKVIRAIPKSICEKHYFAMEEKLRKFSKKIDIPMAELDLLFWSAETGFVFK